jgi:hypothetical protein
LSFFARHRLYLTLLVVSPVQGVICCTLDQLARDRFWREE